MFLPFPHKYRVAGLPLDVEAWVYQDPIDGPWFATLEGGEIGAFPLKWAAEEAVREEYRKVYAS